MITPSHEERFTQVLRVLREVQTRQKPEGFNLTLWSDECGSCACAIGWCCHDPWFNREGLSLRKETYSGGDSPYTVCFPVFNGEEEWEAIHTFFGVDRETADFLFREESYEETKDDEPTSVEQVIERVEAFIRNGFQLIEE